MHIYRFTYTLGVDLRTPPPPPPQNMRNHRMFLKTIVLNLDDMSLPGSDDKALLEADGYFFFGARRVLLEFSRTVYIPGPLEVQVTKEDRVAS